MKLLMFCWAVALITCASSSVDGDILLEMREEFAQMKAEISELKAETAELKAHRNATTAGKLEFFVDGRTVCPDGMAEVNATKGMVLLGRPEGGKTGAVLNRPLDAGEVGRSPPHSHTVTVDDPGHTHVGIVEDPGHMHSIDFIAPQTKDGAGTPANGGNTSPSGPRLSAKTSKTGISIENLPTKSAVSVSVDANDAGENLPLVYVLICQKVA
jgi:hypothetical protein